MFLKHIYSRILPVLLCLSALPATSFGAEVKLTPALAIKEEYNNNISLSVHNQTEDFITTIIPSLEFSAQTERLKRAGLSAGVNFLEYAQNNTLNSVDYFSLGNISWLAAPLYSLDAGFNVTRNSRPDRIDSGSGLAQNSGSLRQSYNLSGTHVLTEKDQLSLAYGYSQESYDDNYILSTDVHQVLSSYGHKLTPETSIEAGANFSAILTNQSTVDNYALIIGFTRKFHELWRLSLSVGGRYTHTEFSDSSLGISSDENMGAISSLSFSFTGEKLKGAIAFNHDLYAGSGSSGATERTGGTAQFEYFLSDALSARGGVGYFLNKSDAEQYSTNKINELTTDINSQLHYDFNKYFGLEATYHYFNVDYRDSGASAYQHVFMMRFIATHPYYL